jgi:hypothetical protein
MTALQRLSLLTTEVPATLSGMALRTAALRTLSIGDLAPWNPHTAKSLEVGPRRHKAGLWTHYMQSCNWLRLLSCWHVVDAAQMTPVYTSDVPARRLTTHFQ